MKMTLNWLFKLLFGFKKTFDIVLENLALRQQPAAMKRSIKRPQLRSPDRLFWVLLSRFWTNWQEALVIVKPETVIGWHRKGFKLFWKFKSRRKGPGRPPVSPEIRRAYSENGEGQSALGRSANSWRVAQTGNRDLRTNGVQSDFSLEA